MLKLTVPFSPYQKLDKFLWHYFYGLLGFTVALFLWSIGLNSEFTVIYSNFLWENEIWFPKKTCKKKIHLVNMPTSLLRIQYISRNWFVCFSPQAPQSSSAFPHNLPSYFLEFRTESKIKTSEAHLLKLYGMTF